VVQAVREEIVDRDPGGRAASGLACGRERRGVLSKPLELRENVDVRSDADVLDVALGMRGRLAGLCERDVRDLFCRLFALRTSGSADRGARAV